GHVGNDEVEFLLWRLSDSRLNRKAGRAITREQEQREAWVFREIRQDSSVHLEGRSIHQRDVDCGKTRGRRQLDAGCRRRIFRARVVCRGMPHLWGRYWTVLNVSDLWDWSGATTIWARKKLLPEESRICGKAWA